MTSSHELTDRERLRKRIRGLYAVTPEGLDEEDLLARCAGVLEGGARVLQYRDKSGSADTRRRQAAALRELTITHRALFIVNDDADLAAEIGADGVHLGREDAQPAEVLARHPQLLVGVSCYDDLDRACLACASGADYLAFGAVAPSPTKPQAVRASLGLFEDAEALELPLVAIGGITLDNAIDIANAGAHALAVVSALFDSPNPAAQARAFVARIKERNRP